MGVIGDDVRGLCLWDVRCLEGTRGMERGEGGFESDDTTSH